MARYRALTAAAIAIACVGVALTLLFIFDRPGQEHEVALAAPSGTPLATLSPAAAPTATPAPSATPTPPAPTATRAPRRATATPTAAATATPTPTATATATATPTATPVPPPPRMINFSIEQFDRDINASLLQARDLGVNMLRIWNGWPNLEPERKGDFHWRTIDNIFAAVDAFNKREGTRIQVVLYLPQTPFWASSDPNKTVGPDGKKQWDQGYRPAQSQDYVDFLLALLGHQTPTGRTVGDSIEYLEVWNEPDLSMSWKSADNPGNEPTKAAADFAQLLNAAYQAIKAASPHVKVVLGGLSTPRSLFFLSGLYENDAQFDVMNLHIYDLADIARVGDIREIVERNGDGEKPFWVTETGMDTLRNSEAAQADFYRQMLGGLRNNYPTIQLIAPYSLFDVSSDEKLDPQQHFGIMTSWLSRKPAHEVVRQYFDGLGVR